MIFFHHYFFKRPKVVRLDPARKMNLYILKIRHMGRNFSRLLRSRSKKQKRSIPSSRGMEYRREMEYRPLKITITINIGPILVKKSRQKELSFFSVFSSRIRIFFQLFFTLLQFMSQLLRVVKFLHLIFRTFISLVIVTPYIYTNFSLS